MDFKSCHSSSPSKRLKTQSLETLLQCGDWRSTAEQCQALLREDSTHIGALELLAKAQWQGSQSADLLRTLSELIRINPYEPGYFALRGATLQRLGRYTEALTAYIRAPKSPGAIEAISELCAWQNAMIHDLLRSDRVFRAEFTRNPEAACEKRGMALKSEVRQRQVAISERRDRVQLRCRPS